MLNLIPFLSKLSACGPECHTPGSAPYEQLKEELASLFRNGPPPDDLYLFPAPVGELYFPNFRLGRVMASDLLSLNELIILNFYLKNAQRWRRETALDLGANVGLHSLILGKLDLLVYAYEPDLATQSLLRHNLFRNRLTNVKPKDEAVAAAYEKSSFVVVQDNTTASHLKDARGSYGLTTSFIVDTIPFLALPPARYIKMDIEGAEAKALCSTSSFHWDDLEIFAEVRRETAFPIFRHFQSSSVNIFSQKIGWQKAEKASDLPSSHREGSIYLAARDEMPWRR